METENTVNTDTFAAIDEIVPTPVVVIKRKATGRRGEIPKVAARRDEVRKVIQSFVQNGPFTVNDIVAAHGLTYYDVQYVARQEQAAGRLVETKNGRKCTYTLPGQE